MCLRLSDVSEIDVSTGVWCVYGCLKCRRMSDVSADV